MRILEMISGQAGAMRLPLYAVTVAAAARVDTPVVLVLHWHGFARETPLASAAVPTTTWPVPCSVLQINQPWHAFDALDTAALEAAWQLGAWDVERVAMRPWQRLGAPAGEALAGHRAFGDYPDADPGCEPAIVEAPDRDDLLALAGRRGYLRWLFRPRSSGLWRELEEDDITLQGDTRTTPCPVAPRGFDGRVPSRVVYRLGRGSRLI